MSFGRNRYNKSYVRIHGRWRRDKPQWLLQLQNEISYWLKKTSRLRHDEPFNKRKGGKQRREQRRFVLANRKEIDRCQQT